MALLPATAEDFAQAQVDLRQFVRAPSVEARNVAVAADTGSAVYFTFRNALYKAEPLSYRLGIQIQEINIEVQRLNTFEATTPVTSMTDDQRIVHMRSLLAAYESAEDLFWKASLPVNWFSRRGYRKNNPFKKAGLSSGEVGELLGFFWECRMKSRVNLLGGLGNRPSLSLSSTAPTNSPLSLMSSQPG